MRRLYRRTATARFSTCHEFARIRLATARALDADSLLMSMSVSAASGTTAQALENERAVSVMKKTRDVEKQTAESLIELVKQAPTAASGRLSVYA